MELFVQINIINRLWSPNDAFGSIFIEIEGIYWVVQVHSDKTGIRLALKNIGIMVPKVYASVCGSYDCSVFVAFEVYDLSTADAFSPYDLELTVFYDDELSF